MTSPLIAVGSIVQNGNHGTALIVEIATVRLVSDDGARTLAGASSLTVPKAEDKAEFIKNYESYLDNESAKIHAALDSLKLQSN